MRHLQHTASLQTDYIVDNWEGVWVHWLVWVPWISKFFISRLMSSWIHQEQSTIDQLSGHRMTKHVHSFTSFWRSSDGNCRENEGPNKPRKHPLFTLISHKQSQCNDVYMQQIANVLLILALKNSRFLIRVMPHRLLREARSRQTTGLTIEHTKRTVKW